MDRRRFLRSSAAGAIALACGDFRVLRASADPVREVEAVAGSGARTVLDASSLQNLRDSLRGALILPGEPSYEDARHGIDRSVDRHPALIVQPGGAADVRTAVEFARSHSLLLAVKCGGHSAFRSTCEGGMMIDLSHFRGVRIDPRARVAHVAGGCLLGDVDHESMSLGLVTPAGVVSHTGVGGLTLGAGFGRLQRRWGLTIDNLVGADLVTADGQLRHVSAEENQELHWAIRGGGGNFGVVTNFQFRLRPMQRQVIGGRVFFPLSRARDVLDLYSTFSLQAPDELYLDFIYGQRCAIDVCWSGDARQADRILAPLGRLGPPLESTLRAIDYLAIQRERDRSDPLSRNEEQRRSELRTGFADGFDGALVRALLEELEDHPQRRFSIYIQHAGGEIGRVTPDATAFPHRRATHVVNVTASWPLTGDDAVHTGFVDKYWRKVVPFTNGYYANLVDRDRSAVESNYRGNLPRLRRIKNKYDPTNLFRLNANIEPTV